MSDVILNLDGGTITLTTDTNLYQITDESIGHNGILVIQAGVILSFADTLNAGFTSVASNITVTVNGTENSQAYIRSDNTYPDHRWNLPASTTSVNATRCTFVNYAGDFQNAWTLLNCLYILTGYTYCTTAELVALTGTTLSDAILMEIIGQASGEINARLALDGIALTNADDPIIASICREKAKAGVMWRMIADGTRSGSINVDGGSSMGDTLALIEKSEAKAEKMLVQYIRVHLPSSQKRLWAQKVNEHG